MNGLIRLLLSLRWYILNLNLLTRRILILMFSDFKMVHIKVDLLPYLLTWRLCGNFLIRKIEKVSQIKNIMINLSFNTEQETTKGKQSLKAIKYIEQTFKVVV